MSELTVEQAKQILKEEKEKNDKIEKLNQDIEKIKKTYPDVYNARQVISDEFKPIFKVIANIKHKKDDGFANSCIPNGTELLNFVLTQSNKTEQEQYEKKNNIVVDSEDMNSVYFYVFNNVLLYDSGGHVILQTPMLINKKEWELLKQCDPKTLKKFGFRREVK